MITVDSIIELFCRIDYPMDEVLSLQTEEIQAFLGQTSVLDRFCAPLCDVALGISTGLQILRQIETDNLFLVSLDNERR